MKYVSIARISMYIAILLLFAEQLSAKYTYDYTICAMFQNETRFLREWIEFHRLTGAQKFYLYNNFSTDNYKELLEPYIQSGVVQLFEWPYENSGLKAQITAFNNTLSVARDEARWVAFLDLDEFLFPVQKYSMQDFLKDYDEYAQVSVNWVFFGTSDVAAILPQELMTESLRRSYAKGNKHVKNIVQPSKVVHFISPHVAREKPGFLQVNADKVTFHGPFSPYIAIDKVRINHYWVRDELWLRTIKIPRGVALKVNTMVIDDDSWFIPHSVAKKMGAKSWILALAKRMNQDFDYSIKKYIRPLRAAVFREHHRK